MAAIFLTEVLDFKAIQENWSVFEETWHNLYGFLIYTNEDLELANYVRNFYNELDSITGQCVLLFLIDDFNKSNDGQRLNETHPYWKKLSEKITSENPRYYTAPHPKEVIYRLADELGIEYDQIPCLTFFHSLEDEEIYLYKIDENKSYKKQFRSIFKYAKRCCDSSPDRIKQYDCLKRELRGYKITNNMKRFLTWLVPFGEKLFIKSIT